MELLNLENPDQEQTTELVSNSRVWATDVVRGSIIGQLLRWLTFSIAIAATVGWLFSGPGPTLLVGAMLIGLACLLVSTIRTQVDGLILAASSVSIFLGCVGWHANQFMTLPIWLSSGPFSPRSLAAAGGMILAIGLADFWLAVRPSQFLRAQFKSQPALVFLSLASAVAVGTALIAVGVQYLLRPPEIDAQFRRLEDASNLEISLLWLTQTVTTCGMFGIGAAVGSFVNVLAYRMPAGRTVLKGGSACPACGAEIQGRDNIPILGWLQLNGRCRNCQVPISVQYPLVELVGGTLVVVLLFWQTLSGGWNLPVRTPNSYNGFVWIIFYTKWDLIGLLAFHAFLAFTLLTWWLIHFHRQRIPTFSLGWALGMIVAATMVWPGLLPVNVFWPGDPWPSVGGLGLAVMNIGTGMLCGLLLGTLTNGLLQLFGNRMLQSEPHLSRQQSPRQWLFFFALLGAGLGWQAVVTIWAIWCVLLGLTRLFRNAVTINPMVPQTLLLAAAGGHHLFWRQLCNLFA